MKYPDVTLKEPQLPDGVKLDIACSLRLYGGRLYRRVSVSKCTTSDPINIKATFIAINDVGQSIILRSHSPVHPLQQWPIIEFDPTERYVLIDLEPRGHEAEIEDSIVHSVVVCRELTAWKPPQIRNN